MPQIIAERLAWGPGILAARIRPVSGVPHLFLSDAPGRWRDAGPVAPGVRL